MLRRISTLRVRSIITPIRGRRSQGNGTVKVKGFAGLYGHQTESIGVHSSSFSSSFTPSLLRSFPSSSSLSLPSSFVLASSFSHPFHTRRSFSTSPSSPPSSPSSPSSLPSGEGSKKSNKSNYWLLGGSLLASLLYAFHHLTNEEEIQGKRAEDFEEEADSILDTSNPVHYDERPILEAIVANPLEEDLGDVPEVTSDPELLLKHRKRYSLFSRAVASFLRVLGGSLEIGFMTLRVIDLWVRFTPLITITTLRFLHLIPRSSFSSSKSSTVVDENGEVDYDADWWGTLPHRVLLWTLESCGPCFIKLGQWAATRPDLFPEVLCYHLSKLHTACPTHPFSHTQEMIEQLRDDKGKHLKLEQVFDNFEQEPIASGAIAQVHKATLRATGEVVAVKVRHPNVVEDIVRDLKILKILATVGTVLFGLESMSLDESVDQFSVCMRMQVDLRREALNLIRFGKNFRELAAIRFPRAYVPLCLSPAVLVESFEVANPISLYLPSHHHHQHHSSSADRKASLSSSLSSSSSSSSSPSSPSTSITTVLDPQYNSPKIRKTLASLGARMFLKMLTLDNFIHADLHPGNILVREEVNSKGRRSVRIIVLDVGLVSELSEHDRENFLLLFSAVAAGDSKKGAELMATKSRGDHSKQTPEQIEYFKNEMDKLLTAALARPISEIEVGPVLSSVLSLCRRCNVKIESNYATMVVGIIVVEGLARQLHADFNLLDEARPFLQGDVKFVKSYLAAKLSHRFKKRNGEKKENQK